MHFEIGRMITVQKIIKNRNKIQFLENITQFENQISSNRIAHSMESFHELNRICET